MKAWHNVFMALPTDKYMKIRLNSLPPGLPVPFDLFVHIGNHFVHYLRAGDTIAIQKVTNFEKKAPEAFYILSAEREHYQKFIRSYLNSTAANNQQKAIILRESTMVLIEEMFENPNIERVLHDARQVVDDFITFMDSDTSALADLIGLSSHDFYTYNHSLDVAIYSLGLGQAVGFSGKDLKELGLGGLFHDIGKRFISLDIICKTGALTEEEWAQMQKHPQYGLSILTEHKAPANVKACAFEHHESFGLGNGYPMKISGDLIHPMARVVAVVDTYDALTTKRSYHDPMRPTEAIELMNSKLASRFDPDVMKAMNFIFDRMKRVA